jgi:hypothetical protein
MKTVVCTLLLLFATALYAQDLAQPWQEQNLPQVYSDQQPLPTEPPPTPIPSVDDSYVDQAAIAATVTTDNVTLPGAIGALPHDQLAYSLAQRQDSPVPSAYAADRSPAF